MGILAAVIGPTIDVVLAIASAGAAAAWILFKVIIPGAKGLTIFNEEIAPNVKYHKFLPKLAILDRVMAKLEDVAAQFTPNSGTTLKDTADRLEGYAAAAREVAESAREAAESALAAADQWATANRTQLTVLGDHLMALQAQMSSVKELARDDRELARKDRDEARDLHKRIAELAESAVRADESRARTEASGARIEEAGRVVAEDLAATQKRADEVPSEEPPGTAADAASQSPDEP
jgi:hypothetical protein